MKSTAQRIDPVKQVAQQKEKSAANTLTQSQQKFGSAQTKLHELIQYRADYVSEFQHKAKKGMQGSQLQHYKAFLGQLDKAISAQQQQIELLKSQLDQDKHNWQQTNHRSKMVSNYQAKVAQKENDAKQKRDGRALEDDYNNSRYSKSG
ncbi:MAG: flagellar export protein FliJ [Kangiellaceae bacterium]|nr:flagellar export protein FliJ [Kangiellaceae bacterium]